MSDASSTVRQAWDHRPTLAKRLLTTALTVLSAMAEEMRSPLLQLASMFQAGLASAAVLGVSRQRCVDLIRQEAQHRRRNGLTGVQAKALPAKQGKFHCGPKLIGRAATSR